MNNQPTEDTGDLTHPCPHCGSDHECCDHLIVQVEWTDMLPYALDTDAMEKLTTRLAKAVVALVDADAVETALADPKVGKPLAALLGHEDIDCLEPDDIEGSQWNGATLQYWLDVAAAQPGCTLDKWDYLADGPGGSCSFESIYAKEGEAAFAAIVKQVKADLATLKRLAT
jgi:hypothetical protein